MKRTTLALAALALIAAPAFALGFDPVIENGSDIWQTPANGTSAINFRAEPLPAGFFCAGSEPFDQPVTLHGVPLATTPAGALGATDTIVQRLDNAVFDENGVAVTRLQVSAIHLRSIQPLQTSCGAFQLDMTLDGEQPIGQMKIVRQGPGFGYYDADVALSFKLTFTSVGQPGETLELTRSVAFPTNRNFWASRPGEEGVAFNGFVSVDTDADGSTDTFIPGTSRNFAPGWFGNRGKDGLLHRADSSSADVAGQLMDLSAGPLRVTTDGQLRGALGALQAQEPALRIDDGEINCNDPLCHCETSYAWHCQQATIQ